MPKTGATILLSGMPDDADKKTLTKNLEKLFNTEDIGPFRVRELPMSWKWQFALDFKTTYDAFWAQSILDGYCYSLTTGEEYRLKAKINKNPNFESNQTLVDFPNALMPLMPDEVLDTCNVNLDAQLKLLKKQKLILQTKREILKEKRKLEKEYKRKHHSYDSEDERPEKRRKHRCRNKSKDRRCRHRSRSKSATRSKSQDEGHISPKAPERPLLQNSSKPENSNSLVPFKLRSITPAFQDPQLAGLCLDRITPDSEISITEPYVQSRSDYTKYPHTLSRCPDCFESRSKRSISPDDPKCYHRSPESSRPRLSSKSRSYRSRDSLSRRTPDHPRSRRTPEHSRSTEQSKSRRTPDHKSSSRTLGQTRSRRSPEHSRSRGTPQHQCSRSHRTLDPKQSPNNSRSPSRHRTPESSYSMISKLRDLDRDRLSNSQSSRKSAVDASFIKSSYNDKKMDVTDSTSTNIHSTADSINNNFTDELGKAMKYIMGLFRVIVDTKLELEIILKESERKSVMNKLLADLKDRLSMLKLNRYMLESEIIAEYQSKHSLKEDTALIHKLINEVGVIEISDDSEPEVSPTKCEADRKMWYIVSEVLQQINIDKMDDDNETVILERIKEEHEDEYSSPDESGLTVINTESLRHGTTNINITIKAQPTIIKKEGKRVTVKKEPEDDI